MDLDYNKYITFKRDDFVRVMIAAGIETVKIFEEIGKEELKDAVVIRRQDKFASPCLLTYAAMIAMVADSIESDRGEELGLIADYFHQQGVLAGEEGWKLPDL